MAQSQQAPISMVEAVSLSSLGVPQQNIAFTHVTMESEKYICVRETGTQNNVVIVDMNSPQSPQRRQISADSALMNPNSKILALKASVPSNPSADSLQIFNLDTKSKLKSQQLSGKVELWKWINPNTIGIVTNTQIYHWSIQGNSEPYKMFDRATNLQNNQIINYKMSSDEKWLLAIGLAPPDQGSRMVKGNMQLYSVEQQKSQSLEAHAASFASVPIEGRDPVPVIAFCSRNANESKLMIIELGSQGKPSYPKRQHDLFFPPGFEDDFPVSLQISEKYGLVYIVTKAGLLFVFDLHTATAIYRNRISQDPVFLACIASSTGGIYAINRKGQVLDVNINEQTFVPFISQTLQNVDLALSIAKRGNLPGAENLVQPKFESLFKEGNYKQAADLVASSPKGALRTRETVSRFQQVPTPEGQTQPLLQYFGACLQTGRLYAFEAIELAKLVISQNKKHLLDNWLKDDKLECSEELGDLIANNAQDEDLALRVYERANCSAKVVQGYAVKGEFEKMNQYCSQTGYSPNYLYLLQTALMKHPQGAVTLATQIASLDKPPLDINQLADQFLQRSMVREATSFLLDVLKDDKEEHAKLQTKVLEINLTMYPNVADAILSNNMFSHYDRPKIAQLCEKAGLYLRALQHYTDLGDIKRVLANASSMDPQSVVDFFGTLSREDALSCLHELLRVSPRGNLQVVVQVCKEYTQQLGSDACIDLFEKHSSYEGLFFYLGGFIHLSEDPSVHFKYIEAASKTGQIKEVERITRESQYYDPERAKLFLMEAKLQDARPLMNVCDRYGYVYDLTTFLHRNNMSRYIEGYVQKVNPANTPIVVGALLDVEAGEEFVKNLIVSVRSLLPVSELTEAVEKRNRLQMLNQFLESLVSEGSQDPNVHDALAKTIIDSNNNPEHFLQTNQYYQSEVVGKYCEKRDPNLACIAYKRGNCDKQLVEVTKKNSLFKMQARYVVERMDNDLWDHVLAEDNEQRQNLIDQVVATALPESKNPEQVSVTVKAFMNNDLPNELIELLEKIVLQNSAFSQNPNLQNLLILTAVKADHTRVMGYINRLDSFDGPAVADIAVGSELYEEAFAIFKKFKDHVKAVNVLLENMDQLERAEEFASKVDEAEVWSAVAKSQLEHDKVETAVESYLKADDTSNFDQVIEASKRNEAYSPLVKFLKQARRRTRETRIENELMYGLAKTESLRELEEFLRSPNSANALSTGNRFFGEEMYEAAKILYQSISAWGKLAQTLVKLHQYNAAVDACRKANDTNVWKFVCFACVDENEFKLAQLCAHAIIVHADQLEEVSAYYQQTGHFDELIQLIENSLGLERAHMGLFTELAILYAKFKQSKLQGHLDTFINRMNIPRVIEAAKEQGLWKELVSLHKNYDEHDHAASVMMGHPSAFDHTQFKEIVVRTANMDLYYRAVRFYMDMHPNELNDVLAVLAPRLDHARVVDLARKEERLGLIKPYLESVQGNDIYAVNEAVNELYLEEQDAESLQKSIDEFTNFDQLGLAARLENNELQPMRRISSSIYKHNKRFLQSIELSKKEGLFLDANQTAKESNDKHIAESLLKFFVDDKRPQCFAACLYTCYGLVRPDYALELGWSANLMDQMMPFMIQQMRDYHSKVEALHNDYLEHQKSQHGHAADPNAAAYAHLLPPALPGPEQSPQGGMPGQFAGQNGQLDPSQMMGSHYYLPQQTVPGPGSMPAF